MSQRYCSQSQRFLGSRDNDVVLCGDEIYTTLQDNIRRKTEIGTIPESRYWKELMAFTSVRSINFSEKKKIFAVFDR